MSQLHENWAETLGPNQGVLMTADEPLAGNEAASKVFGAKVRAARLAKGLTQRQLAELSEVERLQIIIIERGDSNPKLETMTKVAAALGCQIHELLMPG
jgi:DNA-binding XRE family transcriptional regulator